jgi:hypothetical protein
LESEQGILDEHENKLCDLAMRLAKLLSPCETVVGSSENVILSRKLRHLEKSIGTAMTNLSSMSEDINE